MKHKIMKISIFILLLAILLPNQIFAISSSGGYEIEAYNIDMKVNEDNTFDITETISVNFTSYGKHGVFRKIPLKNRIERLDGTTSNNRTKITNISVSDEFKTSNDSGYKVIKIGNANKTVSGIKTYTIKYTYNIGKDPLKNEDELYYNLIGTEWDTSINNVTFTITMPKSFDKTKLGFSTGYKYSSNSSNVTYNVIGNTIKGSVNSELHAGQGVTVRLTLPEGYFVGASSNFDYTMLLKIAISIICVIIAYFIWNKYGRDKMVIDTVEFYPPDDLNSAEVAFIYNGHSEQKDIISLLIYLANKGYLRIEEYEETTLKVFKSKNFKIIKVKEYDGDNEDEREFFNGLFKGIKLKDEVELEELKQLKTKISANDLYEAKEEVTRSDLYNRFYITLNKIRENINKKENKEKIFEKDSLDKRRIILIMIGLIFMLMDGFYVIKVGIAEALVMILFCLIAPLVLLYNKSNVGTVILSSLFLVITGFTCMVLEEGSPSMSFWIEFLIHSACMVILIIFLAVIKRRTEYGREMLGKIQGFKKFLEMAEKPRLEQLVMEDPEYFYNILPYTYALGVSSKWIKKFEDIALEAPHWYYGYTSFSTRSFNSFMNSTYSSISNAMSSSPSSSGGSGGGSSGGGSGGGGGGSW